MNNIKDKVVIITGASSGIGEASAHLLSQQGAKLVLVARRAPLLQRLADDLRTPTAILATDVRSFADLQAVAALAVQEFGRIDVLLNNAGIMPLAPLGSIGIDDIDRVIDINLKGLIYAIKAVLPQMTAQGSGQIINISSIAGFTTSKTSATYSATKFGVRAVSEGLRKEVGDKIRITTIYPGPVATDLASSVPDELARRMIEGIYATIGLDPTVIAEAVRFVMNQPDNVSIDDITVNPKRAG